MIAFRLSSHQLSERLDEAGLLQAAGACAVQNSPPGSALLALHARVQQVTPQRLEQAVAESRTLLQTWCMRGAPFFFPTADAAVFTTGVLPPTEAARLQLVRGVEPALNRLDLSLAEAVALTASELSVVLAGRRLAINELGVQIAERIARRLPGPQRARWTEEGPYAADQPLGEAVVHFCVRILTLQAIVCFGPRAGNAAPFVLVEEWLGHPIPSMDPDVARAELLRRYLHCYGPSNRADFAAWLGVRAGDAGAWWRLVEDELTPVEYGGTTWIRTDDLGALHAATMPTGVRLLPPRDPYTQLRDRETIVDKAFHREVWRTAGEPGTVLVDGRIAGTWRPRKSGGRLTVTIRTFRPLPDPVEESLLAEIEQVASLRGATSAEVEFGTY